MHSHSVAVLSGVMFPGYIGQMHSSETGRIISRIGLIPLSEYKAFFFPNFCYCKNNTMIRFIRCGQTRNFSLMSFPVKVSAITIQPQCHSMSIHIFCRGMLAISTQIKWLAVDPGVAKVLSQIIGTPWPVCQIHEFCNIEVPTPAGLEIVGKYCFCIRFKVFFMNFTSGKS